MISRAPNLLRNNFIVQYICFSSMPKKTKKDALSKEKRTDTEDCGPFKLDKSNNVLVTICAKPGAKQNAITGITEEGVSVQINAPPTEGEANAELVRFISAQLGLRKSDVTLDRGFKSRNKTFKITSDLSIEEIKKKLLQ